MPTQGRAVRLAWQARLGGTAVWCRDRLDGFGCEHPATVAITVGAGVGGLATALFFQKHGIGCDVFESAPAIQELGVGINLMPQAVASLDEVGLLPALEATGIAPEHLFYRTDQGAVVWDEPRGRSAGLPCPHVSIHRGRLQRLLYDAVQARSPAPSVHVDRAFVSFRETGEEVDVTFRS